MQITSQLNNNLKRCFSEIIQKLFTYFGILPKDVRVKRKAAASKIQSSLIFMSLMTNTKKKGNADKEDMILKLGGQSQSPSPLPVMVGKNRL